MTQENKLTLASFKLGYFSTILVTNRLDNAAEACDIQEVFDIELIYTRCDGKHHNEKIECYPRHGGDGNWQGDTEGGGGERVAAVGFKILYIFNLELHHTGS